VALACVLFVDLGRRALDLGAWYTNDGLLPNHTLLWRPVTEWQFSFFFAASTPGEAAFGMLVCALAYALLLVGYRTKLAQLASLACVLSLHARAAPVSNGGDIVLGELALWTALLPTGKRYSLDALIARKRRERTGSESPPSDRAPGPVVSLAVLGLTLQLVCIYLFNALNKSGVTWREGTVVHYMLFHSGIVTPLGEWARGFITLDQSRVLTYVSWLIEASLPLLLLSPVARRPTRRLVVALIVLLHAGFALFLNLGVFVLAMIAFAVHFIPGDDWAALERFVQRRAPANRWLGVMRERVERLAERLARKSPVEPSVTLRRVLARSASLREVAAAVLVVLLFVKVLLDNPAVTKLGREHEPTALRAVASYLQFAQSWGMYAPDADTTDMNVTVDAFTIDGRRVDPFNEAASPNAPRPGNAIPSRLAQDNLFCAYAYRIANLPNYHQAFTEWILRYSDRTGRQQDRIVQFQAYLVTDEAPKPGGRAPSDTRATRFLAYP
jgi:hypothetical protein